MAKEKNPTQIENDVPPGLAVETKEQEQELAYEIADMSEEYDGDDIPSERELTEEEEIEQHRQMLSRSMPTFTMLASVGTNSYIKLTDADNTVVMTLMLASISAITYFSRFNMTVVDHGKKSFILTNPHLLEQTLKRI